MSRVGRLRCQTRSPLIVMAIGGLRSAAAGSPTTGVREPHPVACDPQGDAALRRSAAPSQALLWYQWIRPALQTDHSQIAPGGYAQGCHGIQDRRSGTNQMMATATYSATATNGPRGPEVADGMQLVADGMQLFEVR